MPRAWRARAQSGCELPEQSFLQVDLPVLGFDGVFANTVLFSSEPRAAGQEDWNNERYGVFHDGPNWCALVTAADLKALKHFYRPTGSPTEQQFWLASAWPGCGSTAPGQCVSVEVCVARA